ncbi:MAG TPA: serpin family protein [Verrucomicrobiae bacterium]|nr:serpin family protein [Verrucomicrobiae bacterium]
MQTTIPIKTRSRRRWRHILLGILFEIALFAIVCIPPATWLASEIRNLIFFVHLPIFFFLGAVSETMVSGGMVIVLLLLGLIAMGLFWGLVFNWILSLNARLWAGVFVSQRQRLLARRLFGLIIVLAFIVAISDYLPAKPRPFTMSPDVQSVVKANNGFAIDLYQKLRDNQGNLFLSPFSISAALAMTYAGADGPTKSEMASVLHFDSVQTNIPAAFQKLNNRIRQVQRWNRITLMTANSIWCQQNHSFAARFLELIHEYYSGDAESVDFINAPEAAQSKINSWVARATDEKIENLIGSGKFSALTRLVLCNAIYFKGKWQTQFKASETRPAPFYVSTNQIVTVAMMWQEFEFKTMHSDFNAVELLELPYTGRNLSMIIILPAGQPQFDPDGSYSLSDVERQLTAQTLRSWVTNLDQREPHKTDVSIPRFTIVQDFDISDELKSLGMASAFDENRANFSGIDGTNDLFLSGVIHKAFVDVNESGTEAVAASWFLVKIRGNGGAVHRKPPLYLSHSRQRHRCNLISWQNR